MGLDDKYKDSELNFGRLLVLNGNAKNKLATIKRCVRSKYAKRVKQNAPFEDANSLLINDLCRGFDICGQGDGDTCQIFQVDSDAASAFAALGLEGFIAAIDINASELKKLHNSISFYDHVVGIINHLERARSRHSDYIQSLAGFAMLGHKLSQIDIYTEQLETLSGSYGSDLQSESLATIKTILTSSW